MSLGHVLRVPFARVERDGWPAALDELRAAGLATRRAHPGAGRRAARARSSADAPERVAVLVGAEGPGLTDAALAAVDRRVRIPMAPGADSVNVATAAAIALAALHGPGLSRGRAAPSRRWSAPSARRSPRRRRCTAATWPIAYRRRPGRRPPGVRQDPPAPAAGLLHHRGHRADLAARAPGGRARAEVLAVADDEPAHLVLEWIEPGRARRRTTEAELGYGPRRAAPRPERRASGARTVAPPAAAALPNEPTGDLGRVLRRRSRLLPLARLARDGGALPERACAALEDVAGRLDDDLRHDRAARPPPRRPLGRQPRSSTTQGRSWLIDPAAHGGHREFDLAMMRLFGGFGPDVFAAYAEAHPLEAGWEERVPLHQLAPLAVHAIKFGGSYVAATEAIRSDSRP